MSSGRPSGRPRRRPRRSGTAFLTTTAVIALGAVLVFLFVLHLAQSPNVKNQLGEPVFIAGRATDLARQIVTPSPDGRRGPLLFQALVRDRDIYLQHLGGDPASGWISFEARAPGAARTCVLQWLDAQSQFRDPCSGRTYPADGTGLVHFATSVDKTTRRVVVDLRRPLP